METHKDLPEIFSTIINDIVSIVIKGTKDFIGGTYRRRGNVAIELHNAVVTYREEPTELRFKDIISILSPVTEYVESGIFEYRDKDVYLTDTNIPVPHLLHQVFINYKKENILTEPLENFWQNCILNPNVTARNSFFKYCRDYGIVITDLGYAVLYKAVKNKSVPVDARFDLPLFLGEQSIIVKKQRKSLNKFNIWKGKDGFMRTSSNRKNNPEGYTLVGNMQELHNNLGKEPVQPQFETVFTDKYSGQMTIRLGEPVQQDRKLCDPNINIECSKGLHIGSHRYVKSYAGNTDTVLVCLVNPRDIVAVPRKDSSKIRTCEYFPYGIIKRDNKDSWTEIESRYFESDYGTFEIEKLREMENSSDISRSLRKIVRSRIMALSG